jgi:hypothetical protein
MNLMSLTHRLGLVGIVLCEFYDLAWSTPRKLYEASSLFGA